MNKRMKIIIGWASAIVLLAIIYSVGRGTTLYSVPVLTGVVEDKYKASERVVKTPTTIGEYRAMKIETYPESYKLVIHSHEISVDKNIWDSVEKGTKITITTDRAMSRAVYVEVLD